MTPPINSVSDERLAEMLESARRLELSEWVSAWTELTELRAARRAANRAGGVEVPRELLELARDLISLYGYNPDWKDVARRLDEVLSASLAAEAEPVVEWGDAKTVGNLIAQLRTLDPSTPIYGAFHADAGDGRKARIRGLILSRERVNGRLIDAGNVTVPYAIVAWSAPQSDPEPTRSSPVSAEVTVTDEMANAALAKSLDTSLVTLTNTEAMRQIIIAALALNGGQP